MTAQSQTIVDYYDSEADDLARMYDSIGFESVHPDIAEFLPALGASVLDVGSGSGRDAIAMASRGYTVVAAEPAYNLREHAIKSDVSGSILWLDDRLPALENTRALSKNFEFILCSAVLMLVARSDLPKSFQVMSDLLATNGSLAITVRSPTESVRDRLFIEHPTAMLKAEANTAGLRLIKTSETGDALGRSILTWRTFVWKKI